MTTTKHTKGAKMGQKIIFKEESYRIVGAGFEVYKAKGNGFLEAVFQECLSFEFSEQGIPFVEATESHPKSCSRAAMHPFRTGSRCAA